MIITLICEHFTQKKVVDSVQELGGREVSISLRCGRGPWARGALHLKRDEEGSLGCSPLSWSLKRAEVVKPMTA